MNKTAIKNVALTIKKLLKEKISQAKSKSNSDIAYVWFRRLICLIYLKKNAFLLDGTEPIFLASHDDDLREKIIKQWERLHELLPDFFEALDEDIKWFLPNNIGSIIPILTDTHIPLEDWQQPEIIGWFYQYYFSDRHEEVAGINNSRIPKEDIFAATQLFTPKWIVQYMVDNSLGRYWIEASGDDSLVDNLKFYIKPKRQTRERSNEKKCSPKDIKILDPACGTGHILLYAFDVLYDIYTSTGYPEDIIPQTILEHNLYGLDIDERTVELCRFALLMKCRQKNGHFFQQLKNHPISWNVCFIEETNSLENNWLPFDLINTFHDGKIYGSILNPECLDTAYCTKKLENIKTSEYMEEGLLKKIENIIKQTKIMQQKYDVVVANPPYMSNKMMPAKLKEYVDHHFQDYKGDLFAVFMKRCMEYTKPNGYAAFMTPFVWMFIKTYEKLREYIIQHKSIVSLIQLQYSGFEGATVPICTFVLGNGKTDCLGDFVRLCDFKGVQNQPLKVLEAIQTGESAYRYQCCTNVFKNIPGMPIAYWASPAVGEVFCKGIPLKEIADARVGLQTSDNRRFVRLWYEVSYKKIGFGYTNRATAIESGMKWFPYNKGGDFRKWYGNHLHVVNWEKDGEEIRAYNAYLNTTRASNIGIANTQYYFKRGITWSFVSSSNFGVRYTEPGFIFDTAGSSAFPEDKYLYYLVALLCSKVSYMNLMVINPTLNFQPGNLAMLPILLPQNQEINQKVEVLAKECIAISKEDWNDFEVSWEFKIHPIIAHKQDASTIQEALSNWKHYSEARFQKIQQNEEMLNKLFIDIYGLENDLSPHIEEQELTIRQSDHAREIRSFISFAVGCMMGRYSLHEEGIVFAGGEFEARIYERFLYRQTGILPVYSEDEPGDDIVAGLIKFVEAVFGKETLGQNIHYIADVLDQRVNESPETRIRRYFRNEFYKDHLRIYQKRPIYWLFSSGKHKSFQAFIYIHRLEEKTMQMLREEYLSSFIKKFKIKRSTLEMEGSSCSIVQKKLGEISVKIDELTQYDKALESIIKSKIQLDLDDGIQINYKKLKEVLERLE